MTSNASSFRSANFLVASAVADALVFRSALQFLRSVIMRGSQSLKGLKLWCAMRNNCNCNYNLFTKLPWPGDSEGTFRSSSQTATCPPGHHTRRRLHTLSFYCWTSSRENVNIKFYSFWFHPIGNRTPVNHFSSRRSMHSTTARLNKTNCLFHSLDTQFYVGK